jgi:hypothetical protein
MKGWLAREWLAPAFQVPALRAQAPQERQAQARQVRAWRVPERAEPAARLRASMLPEHWHCCRERTVLPVG